MDYQQIYNKLISLALNRGARSDTNEAHHIIPKSMGGTNCASNLVSLTPKEHFVAHHLLWKIHKNSKMHYAFWLMATRCSIDGRRDYKVNSRTYETAKAQHRLEVSKTHKGKVRSEESKQKSSISLKGKPAWNNGLTGIYSAETISKMVKSATGRVDSDETKDKKSASAKLRPMAKNIQSDDARHKRNKSNKEWKEANRMMCPHCNKTGVKYNMERYHFNNCKSINPGIVRESTTKGRTLTKYKCPHCGIEASGGNLHRWHLGNCKEVNNVIH